MKKLVLVLAALAVIGLATAPALTPAYAAKHAASKKLWDGWFEEIQKAMGGAKAAAPAKKK